MKRPSFQFYPGDWLNDASLRMCSIEARGLWIDMLAFMHQGSDYGYLKVNHKPILPANLARMVGVDQEACTKLLAELEDAGCFSRDESGAIYSRRMIRDEEIRQKRAAGGALGGNPALKSGTKSTDLKASKDANKVNHATNLAATPSSSSSSSIEEPNGSSSASASRPAAKAVDKSKSEKSSSTVWAAYALAYQTRYGAEPPRNAKANAHCKQLIDRIGAEDAPRVAGWYVTNENMPFYVQRGHPLDSLVKDCEGMLVRMKRGQGMTRAEAAQADTDAGRVIGFRRAAQVAAALDGGDSTPLISNAEVRAIAAKEAVL